MHDTMNQIGRCCVCVFVCVLLTIVIHEQYVMAESQDSTSSYLNAEAILEAWKCNYGSIKNMRVAFSEKILEATIRENVSLKGNLTRNMHVERVEQGQRYHERYSMSEDGFVDGLDFLEFAFDGNITREYWPKSKIGAIRRGLTGRDVELMNRSTTYMLSDLSPDPQLPNRQPRFVRLFEKYSSKQVVLPDLEKVAGEMCHVIILTGEGSSARTYKIWVAQDKGMLPLKFQEYLGEKLEAEIEVEKIAKTETSAGPIWYPAKARRLYNRTFGKIQYEFVMKEFLPNIEVDENTFTFEFPKGTRINDHIVGFMYVAGTVKADEVTDIKYAQVLETDEHPESISDEIKDTHQKKVDKIIRKDVDPIAKEEQKPIGDDSLLGKIPWFPVILAIVLCIGLFIWRQHHVRRIER